MERPIESSQLGDPRPCEQSWVTTAMMPLRPPAIAIASSRDGLDEEPTGMKGIVADGHR